MFSSPYRDFCLNFSIILRDLKKLIFVPCRLLLTDIIWPGPEISQDPASDICQRVSIIVWDWKKLFLSLGRFKPGRILIKIEILFLRAFICKRRNQRAFLVCFIFGFTDLASGSARLSTHHISPHSSENILINLDSVQHYILDDPFRMDLSS